LGYDGPVTLVGDEPHPPYERPPLSKDAMTGEAPSIKAIASDALFAERAIRHIHSVRAVAIDRAAHVVHLSDGSSLPYNKLLLATGSVPRQLPMTGLGSRCVYLRTFNDALAIRAHLSAGNRVAIIGGGFIGLEIAATLRAAGRNVTVVEAVDRLLGRAVAPIIAAHVRQRLEAIGVRILTGTTVARLEGDSGRVSAAITSSGEHLPAQMVIIGIGVVPNVELAETAGLAIGNGIRVDQHMQSSIPEILAIGDAAAYRHWFTGGDVRLESVQNATDQARLAARTILGHVEAFAAVPWFWSDIGDMKLQMVGLTQGGDSHVVLGDLADNKFSIYHYAGSRLLGIESVNRPADHMLGRKMLGAGFSPTPQTVAGGPDSLKAALAAFNEDEPTRATG
ncbi:MAG: NAD(P)/FAD-dependent oxidoreductase, partial [Mesorhizobium sp.]